MTASSGDGVRYSAIELIEGNGATATTHSDTYSFAMLILECVTEEVPFSNIPHEAAVVHARLSKRQIPPRPGIQNPEDPKKCVSDGLWDLMTRCWSVRPEDRPAMEYVHKFLADHNG